ncbi:MAG TPA: selenoneine synthase SenA [Burkholderiaceae bacterium]|nr:selenoneine synthase SenA [Burkholderiaceae bacterium]
MEPHPFDDAPAARAAPAAALATALRDSREQTLATFAVYEHALREAKLQVPYSPELNPPLWELGHVGWFQEWWLARNPELGRGPAANPDVARPPPHRAGADAWFDSGRVEHTSRWRLPLPVADAIRDDLAFGLQQSLQLLRDGPPASDDALYFFRLALFHEDMHHEAAVYMAQHLGIALPGWSPHAPVVRGEIAVEAGTHRLGGASTGFAFDNELAGHDVKVPAFRIDAAPVTWARYLQFVEAGGYGRREHWSDDGWAWLRDASLSAPRYLRAVGMRWQRHVFGRWLDVEPGLPAMNLSCFEAEAFCAWAGRRLPSEAEWERAALHAGAALQWGDVWEWTASAFAPYPGFVAHPYRDYSQPWFGSRRVLRGGSFATHARMKHERYRNFFVPARNDIFAGFRTCALPARD